MLYIILTEVTVHCLKAGLSELFCTAAEGNKGKCVNNSYIFSPHPPCEWRIRCLPCCGNRRGKLDVAVLGSQLWVSQAQLVCPTATRQLQGRASFKKEESFNGH